MHTATYAAALFVTLFTAAAGCTNIIGAAGESYTNNKVKDTYVVTVGVENGYAGDCPGSTVDCTRMTDLLKPYATKLVAYKNKNATKSTIVAAMKEGVKHDLFIFYYSGHGGSAPAYLDTDEDDGRDEYLCLYDKPLLDNDIWAILLKAKGRVVMIFDACHSETMFKLPFDRSVKGEINGRKARAIEPNLLVWSGCPDDSYSYGAAQGGELTNTLRKYFNKAHTYDSLWSAIENDTKLQEFESVQCTKIGVDFGGLPVFK